MVRHHLIKTQLIDTCHRIDCGAKSRGKSYHTKQVIKYKRHYKILISIKIWSECQTIIKYKIIIQLNA